MRKKSALRSDGCVVPVHDEPLPCGAEFDRQTAPQITPRLRTPATVAKAKNKQRSSKRVPAVLDLINQLMLCAPTCPASKLQRHSLVAPRGAKIQLVLTCQHHFRSTVYAPRTQPPDQPPPITVKPAFVVAQGLLVPRLCNVPPAYTIPGC